MEKEVAVVSDEVIICGDLAREIWEEGLYFMRLRMGWQFEEEIAEAFKETFALNGLRISGQIASITDNIYTGGSYGFISEIEPKEKERIEALAENGELIYWNEESGAFIEKF